MVDCPPIFVLSASRRDGLMVRWIDGQQSRDAAMDRRACRDVPAVTGLWCIGKQAIQFPRPERLEDAHVRPTPWAGRRKNLSKPVDVHIADRHPHAAREAALIGEE